MFFKHNMNISQIIHDFLKNLINGFLGDFIYE